MFEAGYCSCCGQKESKHGYGCVNPKCTKYYKLQNTSSNSDYAKCPDTIIRKGIKQCRECGKPL